MEELVGTARRGEICPEFTLADIEGSPVSLERYRGCTPEIYAAYLSGYDSTLPGAQEILDWLVFINIQCPECGAPEWRV
jgi:hypothetical protein